MAELRAVGQALPRIDAEEKARGQAIFGADVQLPHALVGKFLPSPHAHAEILSIDTTEADALPGVRAVITAADIPDVPKYDPASRFHAFLARPYVVFTGQPVAAVAADDLATAEAALELIKVEYRSLPAVLALQEAIRPGCPPVRHGRQTHKIDSSAQAHTTLAAESDSDVSMKNAATPNIANRRVLKHGDMEAAFAESDIIIDHTYTVPVVHQGYIEPHSFVAVWDRTNHVTVWESTQGAFAARDLISNTLGIPLANITLNSTEIGGGFGGKIEGLFSPIVVLLAKKAQRPVKLVLTRHEELVGANPAPQTIIQIKTGAKKDGTLTALQAQVLLDTGAFASNWIMSVVAMLVGNNYNFQAWHIEGMEVLTNKASIAAYRAPGAVNAAFAIESQVDEMARRLGLNPLDFRLKNLTLKGDLLSDGTRQIDIGADEVLAALAAHPAWTDPSPGHVGDDGMLHGRGIGMGVWAGGGDSAAAIAMLESDGTVQIILGTVDLTGSFTSLAQIVADTLGVPVERIVISKTSPGRAPFAPMSAGSQTIYTMGVAVHRAALSLRAKLLDCAAHDFGVSEAELDIEEGNVFVVSQPDKSLSFEMLYLMSRGGFTEHGPLIGEGSVPSRPPSPGVAAGIAEVAVDPETGQVTLTRLTMAQDVGRAINPLSVEGQIQGGAAQSVGMALWEEIKYNAYGQVLNPSLLDYRQATFADIPMIEAILVEAPGGDGPFGARLVGEPPIIPPAAAIANAIADAIGARVCDLPITPERVWRALNLKRGD